VLRIYHSGVVSAYRQRDRELLVRGVNLVLATAPRWDEGGRDVALEEGSDRFVVSVPTVGRHPYVFLYDPRPLARLLRTRRFDLIDAHEEPASLAAAEVLVLRRLFQPSARLTFYSAQNLPKRFPPPFRWIERVALRSAAGVHCCNEAAADQMRRKWFRGHLQVLGLGVDTDRFRPRSGRRPDGPVRIGYVGRIEERKGVSILLSSVALLPAVCVEFVGDGPHRASLERAIEQLGLGERASVRGFAAQDELPGIYRSWDIVCVPSLATPRWIEQFGRVAVEAMASGVPVVASDSGSLPEVLGDAGLLVRPGDVDALTAVLKRVVGDAGLRAELAERGRQRAARYSWPAIAEAHRGVYVEALAWVSTS
jgi:glycosyltransferase involved in cell wall biosynthesis